MQCEMDSYQSMHFTLCEKKCGATRLLLPSAEGE